MPTGQRTTQLAAILDFLEAGFIPLEPVTDAETPTRVRHQVCGREVLTSLHVLRAAKGCGYCRGFRTPEQKHAESVEFGFIPLEEVKGVVQPYAATHVVCGQVVRVRLNNLRNGLGCGYCRGLRTPEQLRVESLERGFEPLEVIKDSMTYYQARHDTCGQEVRIRLNALRNGQGCGYCVGRRTSQQLFAESVSYGFTPLDGEAINDGNSAYDARHENCGTVVRTRLAWLRNSRKKGQFGCKHCSGVCSRDCTCSVRQGRVREGTP